MKFEAEFELSRDPSEYGKTAHLRRRLKERPLLEEDVVASVIEDREVVKVDENEGGSDLCVTLQGKFGIVPFEVKLCPKDKVVQTAYEVDS